MLLTPDPNWFAIFKSKSGEEEAHRIVGWYELPDALPVAVMPDPSGFAKLIAVTDYETAEFVGYEYDDDEEESEEDTNEATHRLRTIAKAECE